MSDEMLLACTEPILSASLYGCPLVPGSAPLPELLTALPLDLRKRDQEEGTHPSKYCPKSDTTGGLEGSLQHLYLLPCTCGCFQRGILGPVLCCQLGLSTHLWLQLPLCVHCIPHTSLLPRALPQPHGNPTATRQAQW